MEFLDLLVNEAIERVNRGYYRVEAAQARSRSLAEAILSRDDISIIAEFKLASPFHGRICGMKLGEFIRMAEEAQVAGLSILTIPERFHGSLDYLLEARGLTDLPILMKDVVVSEEQIDAAAKLGASSILLIASVLRKLGNLDSMVEYAHSKDLEVLLEVHTLEELNLALGTNAELIGINNRDLRTLKVDLTTTQKLMESISQQIRDSRIFVSESGISSREDIQYLRKFGIRAFLVGRSIMEAQDPKSKILELRGIC